MTVTAQPFVDTQLSADLAAAALNVARRFHDGATLWVIAPQWEPHAHHVAVEFVHPVIMGKRALPSVALVGPDPVAQARVASQPGDLLLAVASADEPAVVDAMRRAPAAAATARPASAHATARRRGVRRRAGAPNPAGRGGRLRGGRRTRTASPGRRSTASRAASTTVRPDGTC